MGANSLSVKAGLVLVSLRQVTRLLRVAGSVYHDTELPHAHSSRLLSRDFLSLPTACWTMKIFQVWPMFVQP